MKKIAYVVPTFSRTIGKRENSLNISYEVLKNICNESVDVDVITTCAVNEKEFVNVCVPGVYEEESYTVIRFLIENAGEQQKRERLLEELSTEEWYKIIKGLGLYSPELFNYIHRAWNTYDAVVFWGIDYWPTIIGLHAIPNAILIPNLSSVNIRYACTENYKRAFEQVNYAICFEEREYTLLQSLNISKVCLLKNSNILPVLEQMMKEMSFEKCNSFETTDIEKEILYSAKLKPAFTKNNIPITFASDNNYVHLLCVAMQSIIDVCNSNNNYDFIILSDQISYKSRRNIYRVCADYPNIALRFVEVSVLLEHNEFSFRCEQLSRVAFARLLLPELLDEYEKIVYLDCDVLVLRDLADLFKTNLQDAFVGAIEDPFVAVLRKNRNNEKRHIKLHVGKNADEKYFNSGVLVMNLNMFRKHYTAKQMLAVATQRTWMWEDQDVLNKLCINRVVWLNVNWNYLWGREDIVRDLMKLKQEYFEAYYNPYIVHYAGGCIPLRAVNDEYDVEFWNIARRTPYYEALLADMMKNRFNIQNWTQGGMRDVSAQDLGENLHSKSDEAKRLATLTELSYTEPQTNSGIKGRLKRLVYKVSRCVFIPFAVTQTTHNKNTQGVLQEASKVNVGQQEKIDECRQALLELSKTVNLIDKK